MALNANCVANVTTAGSDSNAGWFDTSSGDAAGSANDRAFSNSPVIIDGSTISASVHSTTTQATLVGFAVTSALRGNVLRITGGTATAGYYRITATDAVNNRVTVDASMGGSGATITGRIGGAFATIGQSGATGFSGSLVMLASGTHDISVNSTNVPGGAFSNANVNILGYHGTYSNQLSRPLIRLTTSPTIFTLVNAASIRSVDGSANGYSIDALFKSAYIEACDVNASGAKGFDPENLLAIIIRCRVTGSVSNSAFTRYAAAIECSASVTGTAFSGGYSNSMAAGCIASNCTGTGFTGVRTFRCVAHACGSGFGSSTHIESIATQCTGAGFASGTGTRLLRCAGWSNAGGNVAAGAVASNDEFQALTATPWTNAALGDFSLNNTPGGGAVLRALNFAMPGISTTRRPFLAWTAPSAGGGSPAFSGGRWQ